MRMRLVASLILMAAGGLLLSLRPPRVPLANLAVAIDLTCPWDHQRYMGVIRKVLGAAAGRAFVRASAFDNTEVVLYKDVVRPETADYLGARLRSIHSAAWGTWTWREGLGPAARWAHRRPYGQVLLFTDGGVEDFVQQQATLVQARFAGLPITVLGVRVRDDVVTDYIKLAMGHPRVVRIEQLEQEAPGTLLRLPPLPRPYARRAGFFCLALGAGLLGLVLVPMAARWIIGIPVVVRIKVEGRDEALEFATRTRRTVRVTGGRPPARIRARIPFELFFRPISAAAGQVAYRGGGHLLVDGTPADCHWRKIADGSRLEPAPGCSLTVELAGTGSPSEGR